jgi:hypothetical protein
MNNDEVSDASREVPLASLSLRAQLSSFRSARLNRVRLGAIIGPVRAERALFVHLLPLGGTEDSLPIASQLEQLGDLLHPIGAWGWDQRMNADGYLLHASDRDTGSVIAYVQWLRCGGLEVFAGNLVSEPGDRSPSKVPIIYSAKIAEFLLADMPKAVDGIRNYMQVRHPLAISGTLSGMKGVQIAQPNAPHASGMPIDRDLVITPWIAIDEASNPSLAIGETGDILWQSAGISAMPRSTSRS